jgi:hypothetical protein
VMTALNFAFGASTKMGRDLGQQIGDNIATTNAASSTPQRGRGRASAT